MAIIHPDNEVSVAFFRLNPADAEVPQYETFSPANYNFLVWLRTRCDSVFRAYLSKIADNAEKRNYLHALYTAVITLRLPVDSSSLGKFLDDMTQILELYPPTFEPCGNPHVLFEAANHLKVLHRVNYLRDFLSNPERSRLFHCDPGLWSAVVAARYIRHLRTPKRDSW